MPSLALDFEVWCSCGEGLCNVTEEGRPYGARGNGGPAVTVEPCEKCIAGAKEEGREAAEEAAEERE